MSEMEGERDDRNSEVECIWGDGEVQHDCGARLQLGTVKWSASWNHNSNGEMK